MNILTVILILFRWAVSELILVGALSTPIHLQPQRSLMPRIERVEVPSPED